MSRQEFTGKTKAEAWLRAGGKCESCGNVIRRGPQYDHRIPCGDGGSNDLANCQVLCEFCHGTKTKTDVTRIAKGKRVHRKHINATSTPRRKIQSAGFPKFERERKRWPGPEAET